MNTWCNRRASARLRVAVITPEGALRTRSVATGCRREKIAQYVFQRFLSVADADRVFHTFRKLGRHDIRRWALTGGLAVEAHRLQRGRVASVRTLNDIDFVAVSFDSIPASLADDFLFRHIHPGSTASLKACMNSSSGGVRPWPDAHVTQGRFR